MQDNACVHSSSRRKKTPDDQKGRSYTELSKQQNAICERGSTRRRGGGEPERAAGTRMRHAESPSNLQYAPGLHLATKHRSLASLNERKTDTALREGPGHTAELRACYWPWNPVVLNAEWPSRVCSLLTPGNQTSSKLHRKKCRQLHAIPRLSGWKASVPKPVSKTSAGQQCTAPECYPLRRIAHTPSFS